MRRRNGGAGQPPCRQDGCATLNGGGRGRRTIRVILAQDAFKEHSEGTIELLVEVEELS